MFVVEGIPHNLDEPSVYSHPQFGDIDSMWFRVIHPDLPKPVSKDPDRKPFEETFEVNGPLIEEIKAAAKAGTVIRMKCRISSAIAKSGKAWSKVTVSELL